MRQARSFQRFFVRRKIESCTKSGICSRGRSSRFDSYPESPQNKRPQIAKRKSIERERERKLFNVIEDRNSNTLR
jgi:hypothetical protein